MRKKLVNEKRNQLKNLSRKELVDRICEYPNQKLLNVDEDGKRRGFPVGMMAATIRANDYQMSDNQYYTLVHYFGSYTVPEMKVVGVTFRENNPETFKMDLISKEGRKSVYEMDYYLVPEPENPYDENAVRVEVETKDGDYHQVGYLARNFVAAYPVTEEQKVKGYLTDHSNGHFKTVSYSLAMDMETINNGKPREFHTYETAFTVTDPISDVNGANAFLEDMQDTMGKVLGDYIKTYDLDFSEDVKAICWHMDTETAGHITLETTGALTEEQLDAVSYFIRLQNEDTTYLGRMFSGQEFAHSHYEDPVDETVEDITAHFNWDTDPYTFEDTFEKEHRFIHSEQGTMDLYEQGIQLDKPLAGDWNRGTEIEVRNYMMDLLKADMAADRIGTDFSGDITNVAWTFSNREQGSVRITATKPLETEQLNYLQTWVEEKSTVLSELAGTHHVEKDTPVLTARNEDGNYVYKGSHSLSAPNTALADEKTRELLNMDNTDYVKDLIGREYDGFNFESSVLSCKDEWQDDCLTVEKTLVTKRPLETLELRFLSNHLLADNSFSPVKEEKDLSLSDADLRQLNLFDDFGLK